MLVFPPEGLDAFDSSRFADHALLTSEAMLAARLLHAQLLSGDADPLLAQEAGVGLLAVVLAAARPEPSGRRASA